MGGEWDKRKRSTTPEYAKLDDEIVVIESDYCTSWLNSESSARSPLFTLAVEFHIFCGPCIAWYAEVVNTSSSCHLCVKSLVCTCKRRVRQVYGVYTHGGWIKCACARVYVCVGGEESSLTSTGSSR